MLGLDPVVKGIATWSVLLDAVAYHWQWAARILKAPPRALIKDGELNLQTARRELLTRAEVRSELRKQGIDDIAKVYRAYVEPNGMISVIERPSEPA